MIGVGRYLYVQAQVKALTQAVEQMQTDMQRRAAERAAAQRRARQAQLQATLDKARLEAAAARAQQDADIRKASAWETFYVPERRCLAPANWDVQVECGNAHIRARRDFEERWSRGEF